MLNKVIINGRMAREIEMKQSETGKGFGVFAIAVTRDFKNSAGGYDSDFFECTAFGQRAEFLSNYVSKGDLVSIVGRLKADTWETKEGEKRYKVGITVEEVNILSKKKTDGGEEKAAKVAPQPKKSASAPQAAEDEDLPF